MARMDSLRLLQYSLLLCTVSGLPQIRFLHGVPSLATAPLNASFSWQTDDGVAGNTSLPNLSYGQISEYIEFQGSVVFNINEFLAQLDAGVVDDDSYSTLTIFGPQNQLQFLLLADQRDEPDIDPNTALVRFVDVTERTLMQNSTIFSRSTWCEGCAPRKVVSLRAHHPKTLAPPITAQLSYAPNEYINVGVVAWPIVFTVSPSGEIVNIQFGYFARYTLILIGQDPDPKAILLEDYAPENWWTPLVIALGALIGLAILVPLLARGAQSVHGRVLKKFESEPDMESAPLVVNAEAGTVEEKSEGKRKERERIMSLDTFRGTCLAIMIFVNYGGGGYWFFDHSYWNGLTLADLVFPWFIFIMGTSMSYTLKHIKDQRASARPSVIFKVMKRGVLLFLIGLFLNNGADLSKWRIPGVLQYFSFTYLVCALVILFIPVGDSDNTSDRLVDVAPFLLQWSLILLFPLVNLIVTFGLNVEGCGAGYLGPGGIGDEGTKVGCVGGASSYVDRKFFGLDHTYQDPTCVEFYECGPHDPEGLLGSLNAVLLCWFGVQCGRIFLLHKDPKQRVIRMCLWALVLGAIGCGLCEGKRDGGVIPVNKNLWSLSFVTVLGSGANIMLAICYLLVDVSRRWNGMPFFPIGRNSILIYIGHELLGTYFPFTFNPPAAGHGWHLFSNLTGALMWVGVAFLLHQNKFYFNL